MPYLIDGHNLIQHIAGLSLDDPDDEMKLVNKLRGFSARVRKRCTVIFDQGIVGGRSTASTDAVEVIFASQGLASADDLIRQRLMNLRDAHQWTLVSADQELIQVGRAVGARIMRSMEFARLLDAPSGPQVEPGEWTHVRVSDDEVDELLPLFDPESPRPAREPKPAEPRKPAPQKSGGKPAAPPASSAAARPASKPKAKKGPPPRRKTVSPPPTSDPTLENWRERRRADPPPSAPPAPPTPSEARPLPVWQRPAPPPPREARDPDKTIKPPPLHPLRAGGYIQDEDVRTWQDYVREDLPLPDDASRGKLKPPKPQSIGSVAGDTPTPTDAPRGDLKIGRGTLTEDDLRDWQGWVDKHGGGAPKPPTPRNKKK